MIAPSEFKTSLTLSISVVLALTLGCYGFYGIGYLGSEYAPIRVYGQLKQRDISHEDLKQAKVVTVGSSHNSAIRPQALGMSTVQLHSPGQNLTESHFLLNYFREHLTDIQFVMLPVSVLSLHQKTNLRVAVAANLLALEDASADAYVFSHDIDLYIRSRYALFARKDAWEGPVRKLLDIEKKRKAREQSPFKKNSARRHVNKRTIDEIAGMQANSSRIAKLAALAKELGACVVFYDSPVSHAYSSAMKELRPTFADWRDEFRSIVEPLQDEYCVHFVESIWPSLNSRDPQFYADQDHLNWRGAGLFSRLLAKRLQSIRSRHP